MVISWNPHSSFWGPLLSLLVVCWIQPLPSWESQGYQGPGEELQSNSSSAGQSERPQLNTLKDGVVDERWLESLC